MASADDHARALAAELRERLVERRRAEAAAGRLGNGDLADAVAELVEGTDLVIFDSSRLILSSNGLDENDECAEFAGALLHPLSKGAFDRAQPRAPSELQSTWKSRGGSPMRKLGSRDRVGVEPREPGIPSGFRDRRSRRPLPHRTHPEEARDDQISDQ